MSTRLRQTRLAAGLSAIELAQRAQTSESRVFSIERGRFKAQKAEAARISIALGKDVEALFPEGVQESGTL